MNPERLAATVLYCVMTACGGTTSLHGDHDATADPVVDTVVDAPVDTVLDTAVDPIPDGECCPPPTVLDPTRGICVDPTGIGASCTDSWATCGFGQLCTPVFGEGYMGDFCHLPCGPQDDWLCPDGYVCSPAQCCDIPDSGCIPDVCAPPLLYHPGLWDCVGTTGLGMDCSMTESCSDVGQQCVRYMGVDGEYRYSCEIPCAGGGLDLCPNGYRCVDWEDGPENVCEPFSDPRGCDDPLASTCGYPEKFVGVDRESICGGCYGAVLCVQDSMEAIAMIGSVDRAGAVSCDEPVYPPSFCAPGEMQCLIPFRSGVDDCPGMTPSVWWWTTVCAVAHLPVTSTVHCYWLE